MPNTVLPFVNWLGCSMLATCALVHSGLWNAETAAHFLITFAVACDLWLKYRAQTASRSNAEATITSDAGAEAPTD